ncbi:MAG: PsbP-related protein [Patescibacteria group bacterium]
MNAKQNGIATGGVVAIIILIVLFAGAAWYWLNRDSSVEVGSNTNTSPAVNTGTNPEPEESSFHADGWQTFRNNEYGYTITFPSDWHYVPNAMSGPPPPATAFFSSEPAESSVNYSSVNILVTELSGETLNTWSEIGLLEEDGYGKTDITVGSEPGVRLERRTLESDTGGTIYVAKNNLMYRIVWGSIDQGLFADHEETLGAIVQSFAFAEQLVPDFIADGVVSDPAEAEDTGSWFLVYEEAGMPGVSAELLFDYEYVPSSCSIGGAELDCADAIAAGSLAVGDSVSIEGVRLGTGVIVLQLTK